MDAAKFEYSWSSAAENEIGIFFKNYFMRRGCNEFYWFVIER